MSKLKQIGVLTFMYAEDNQSAIPVFWQSTDGIEISYLGGPKATRDDGPMLLLAGGGYVGALADLVHEGGDKWTGGDFDMVKKFFTCPSDNNNAQRDDSWLSYWLYYSQVDGFQKYTDSRAYIVGRDPVDNSIWYDALRYGDTGNWQFNHPSSINALRMGGHVDSVVIAKKTDVGTPWLMETVQKLTKQ